LSANVVIASTGSKNSAVGPLDLREGAKIAQRPSFAGRADSMQVSLCLVEERVSHWSQSRLKRLFDIGSVVLTLPLLLPIFLMVGLAVRLTSRGPVLFRQKRTGRYRRSFTILKFRTMEHIQGDKRSKVTTADNQQFTPVGPFLRRWKLDELPQLFNVLMGDMSLVGPRPKLPEHQLGELRCRPGITGAATITFAREEHILASLPDHHLDDFYCSVILPAKLRLDREYMACATISSDLRLIVDTVLRRWDDETIGSVIEKNPAHTQRIAQTISADESLASGD
jgi:lipopolysaccharide/colanic/teichoic acid biosynthesis glycosyltransferase